MQAHFFKLAAFLASLALLVIFLWTPWIVLLDAHITETQVREFLSNTQIRSLFEQAPHLQQWLGIAKLENLQDVQDLFSDAEIRTLFDFTKRRTGLTGLDLVMHVPRVNPFLYGLLIALPIANVITIGWVLLTGIAKSFSFGRLPSIVLAGGIFLLVVSLIMFVPSFYTFGEQDDFRLAFACMLLGAQTGIGLWLALLALCGMGVGVLLDGLFNQSENVQVISPQENWDL